MYISQQEFEQLKEFFDKNKPYEGANFLTSLINRSADWLSDYNRPVKAAEGLQFGLDPYSCNAAIGLAPDVLDKLACVSDLQNQVGFLKAAVADLQKMHQEGGNHIPPIISTKEQAVALQEKLGKEERVLIHTTFDKALRAFE